MTMYADIINYYTIKDKLSTPSENLIKFQSVYECVHKWKFIQYMLADQKFHLLSMRLIEEKITLYKL